MHKEPGIDIETLKPAAIGLIETAERLFAERGIEAVSTREIARAAGQKNHSAVSYHFGSKDRLIGAILAYRSPPIHALRNKIIEDIQANGEQGDVRVLVSAFVLPFVYTLQNEPERDHYVGFVGQLSIKQYDALMRYSPAMHSGSLRIVGEMIAKALDHLPPKWLIERQRLMTVQITRTVAMWDVHRRNGDLDYTGQPLQWRIDNLIDVITAVLTAPITYPDGNPGN